MRAIVFVVVDGDPADVEACARFMQAAVSKSNAVPVTVNWTPDPDTIADNAPEGELPVAVDLYEINGESIEAQLGHCPA